MRTVVEVKGFGALPEPVNVLELSLVKCRGVIELQVNNGAYDQTLFSFEVVDNELTATRWGAVETGGVSTDEKGRISVVDH